MLHLRPIPPPGIEQTLFGVVDTWAQLRADIDDLIERRPVGGYKLILADAPHKTVMRSSKGYGKSPEAHYKTVPSDVLASLPVSRLASDDAVLLFWATAPKLDDHKWEPVSQLDIVRAWGFEYASFAPWFKGSPKSEGEFGDEDWKPSFAGGYLWRNCTELLILATRGNPALKPERRKERAVFFDAVRDHSRKPDDMYRKAETLVNGPYLELFSRTNRDGWTSYGDQSGLFGEVKNEVESTKESSEGGGEEASSADAGE